MTTVEVKMWKWCDEKLWVFDKDWILGETLSGCCAIIIGGAVLELEETSGI